MTTVKEVSTAYQSLSLTDRLAFCSTLTIPQGEPSGSRDDLLIKIRYPDGIQRINAYHSRLKSFLRRLHGVSTKYLGHYLVWHDRMFWSAGKGREEENILFTAALAEPYRMHCREIARRPAVPAGNDPFKEAAA